MKTKDKKELFAKGKDELQTLLKETRDTLFGMKLEIAQNKLKNTRSIFLKRKDIARILTALQQRTELDTKEGVKNDKNI